MKEKKNDAFGRVIDNLGSAPTNTGDFYDEYMETMAKDYNDKSQSHLKPIAGSYTGGN